MKRNVRWTTWLFLLSALLIVSACSQKPSSLDPSTHADEGTEISSTVGSLGVPNGGKPTGNDDEPELIEPNVNVYVRKLIYSDSGLLVTLNGAVETDEQTDLNFSTRWTQISGPPAYVLSPDLPMTKVVLPAVSEPELLQFELAVDLGNGESTKVQSTVNVLPKQYFLQMENQQDSEGSSIDFTVRLLNPADGDLALRYETVNSTAIAGSDFEAVSGLLEFATGEQEKTISVQLTNDVWREQSEYFYVNVFGAASGSTASAVGVIEDNDSTVSTEVIGPSESEFSQLEFADTEVPLRVVLQWPSSATELNLLVHDACGSTLSAEQPQTNCDGVTAELSSSIEGSAEAGVILRQQVAWSEVPTLSELQIAVEHVAGPASDYTLYVFRGDENALVYTGTATGNQLSRVIDLETVNISNPVESSSSSSGQSSVESSSISSSIQSSSTQVSASNSSEISDSIESSSSLSSAIQSSSASIYSSDSSSSELESSSSSSSVLTSQSSVSSVDSSSSLPSSSSSSVSSVVSSQSSSVIAVQADEEGWQRIGYEDISVFSQSGVWVRQAIEHRTHSYTTLLNGVERAVVNDEVTTYESPIEIGVGADGSAVVSPCFRPAELFNEDVWRRLLFTPLAPLLSEDMKCEQNDYVYLTNNVGQVRTDGYCNGERRHVSIMTPTEKALNDFGDITFSSQELPELAYSGGLCSNAYLDTDNVERFAEYIEDLLAGKNLFANSADWFDLGLSINFGNEALELVLSFYEPLTVGRYEVGLEFDASIDSSIWGTVVDEIELWYADGGASFDSGYVEVESISDTVISGYFELFSQHGASLEGEKNQTPAGSAFDLTGSFTVQIPSQEERAVDTASNSSVGGSSSSSSSSRSSSPSSSGDPSSTQETDPIPNDFTVDVASVGTGSAVVRWTSLTIDGDRGVLADIYINGNKAATGFTSSGYVFSSLVPDSEYQVKIVARSSAYGTTVEQEVTFRTGGDL